MLPTARGLVTTKAAPSCYCPSCFWPRQTDLIPHSPGSPGEPCNTALLKRRESGCLSYWEGWNAKLRCTGETRLGSVGAGRRPACCCRTLGQVLAASAGVPTLQRSPVHAERTWSSLSGHVCLQVMTICPQLSEGPRIREAPFPWRNGLGSISLCFRLDRAEGWIGAESG